MHSPRRVFLIAAFFSIFIVAATSLFAEEFYCEALSVQGGVYHNDENGSRLLLKEGDTLKAGDSVETDADSFVDLAYDKEWKNVQRVEANSKVKIGSVYPAKTNLEKGSVFAKLKSLPEGSSFEVQTPTAVATVRGTEYRTAFVNGQTDVFNSSDSSVLVYGRNENGTVSDQPVVLKNSEKTHITQMGEMPRAAEAMTSDEVKQGEKVMSDMQEKIEAVQKSGRVSKIQSISAMEKSTNPMPSETGAGASRVTDLRRRAFKKA